MVTCTLIFNMSVIINAKLSTRSGLKHIPYFCPDKENTLFDGSQHLFDRLAQISLQAVLVPKGSIILTLSEVHIFGVE